MPTLAELAESDVLLTFDCYGTLIDWQSGIGEALRRVETLTE